MADSTDVFTLGKPSVFILGAMQISLRDPAGVEIWEFDCDTKTDQWVYSAPSGRIGGSTPGLVISPWQSWKPAPLATQLVRRQPPVVRWRLTGLWRLPDFPCPWELSPKHASWINQIEISFGILVRKVIRRGNFASLSELEQKLLAFIDYFNPAMAKPFKWTYQAKPLQGLPSGWLSLASALLSKRLVDPQPDTTGVGTVRPVSPFLRSAGVYAPSWATGARACRWGGPKAGALSTIMAPNLSAR
jgi:hypothetical protein